MATTTQASSTPTPPKSRPQFTLFTPGVPWYRDIRILRLIAQLVFVVLFVAFAALMINNLVTNLQASNLSLDFNVYQRPFNVAINEGISMTEPWTWINDSATLGVVGWLMLVAAAVYTGMGNLQRYRMGELRIVPLGFMVILILLAITNPPEVLGVSLSKFLNAYFFPSSIGRAFTTGFYNTLQVVFVSIIGSTLLGIFAGIGLLSRNLLIRTIARVYVEIFRNTPLVVQLIFIYRSLTLLLPAPRQSLCYLGGADGCTQIGNLYIFNARGLYFPRLIPTETNVIFGIALVVGLIVAFGVGWWRTRLQEQTGTPAQLIRYSGGLLLAAFIIGWGLAGTPYTVNYPFLRGPRIEEGMQFTIAFVALALGLVLYTGAFIADIVRAGIQSVPFGQIEAARSQGFVGSQILTLIVLPQALRLIIPPLGNQFVNLGKNSSLALVVSYVDVYRIAQLANNESGQAVPFFLGLMIIYLSLSLSLSTLTNLINRGTRIKSR